MKAAIYRRFGPPDVVKIEEVPKPTPKPNEVLTRIHAASVSIADHRLRAKDLPEGLGFFGPLALGVFRPRKKLLGMDGAGVVEAIGDKVTKFQPGDEVYFLPGASFGCHAEYIAMAETDFIALKPKNLNFAEATSLLFGGTTSLNYLRRKPVKPGDEVLVNGASGSCGNAAVQLAKHMGATVTGVCSAKNADLVRSLGADHVIDYAVEDFATSGKTYDVIVECVGNAPFERVNDAIKPGGALLIIIPNLKAILFSKRRSRKTGKLITASDWKATVEDLEYLAKLAEEGVLKPVIDSIYPLEDIVQAHARVDTGHKVGNVLVTMEHD